MYGEVEMPKWWLFLRWMRDMGGSYREFVPEPRVRKPWQNYQPEHRIRQRPLNPRAYYTDSHGSIRRRKLEA